MITVMMGDRQQKQQQRRRTQRQVQQRRQPLNLAGSTKGASPGAEEHIESTRSKRVDRGSCERGAVVHVRPCSASSAPSASGATRAAGRDPSEDAAHCAHGAADGAAPSPPSAGPTPTAWVFICVSWGRPRITHPQCPRSLWQTVLFLFLWIAYIVLARASPHLCRSCLL